MTKDCWLILFIAISGLTLLVYLVIAVFLTPIKAQCDYNETIPDDAPINLSMSEWQGYGMIFALSCFGLLTASGKIKTNSECVIAVLAGLIILYVIFIFVWSIIGLVIYEHYYAQACHTVEQYNSYTNLAIFFGLTYSSMHILVAIGAAFYYLLKSCGCERIERVPLLQQSPQLPPPQADLDIIAQIQAEQSNGDSQKYYVKPPSKKQEVLVVTDAQFQQNRNIYSNMFNRLSGNRWSRDHRQN